MGGVSLHLEWCACLKLILTTKLTGISFYFFMPIFMTIDVNQMEEDVMQEHIAPDNEKAREMLDRLSQEMLWMSAQELYLRWILKEIAYLQDNAKDASDREKLLKYLKEIDNICGFSKDKRDVKIETKLRSASDIFNSTNLN